MDAVHPDAKTIEHTIKGLLDYLDISERPGLKETPRRVRESWKHLFAGYDKTGEDILKKQFEECKEYDEVIILKGIDFYSFCEHHCLPIIGVAHVGYIPQNKIVGISKLARLVEIYARRLQIQERMTIQIANDIDNVLDPLGTAVVIVAKHLCISARGVEKQNAEMITSRMTGVFREKPEAREEFLNLCGLSK
jgi:GTP cyclohydrolase I